MDEGSKQARQYTALTRADADAVSLAPALATASSVPLSNSISYVPVATAGMYLASAYIVRIERRSPVSGVMDGACKP